MMTLAQIRAALADKKLSVVAQKTGLSYRTILEIKNGVQENPTRKTLFILDAYLRSGVPQ